MARWFIQRVAIAHGCAPFGNAKAGGVMQHDKLMRLLQSVGKRCFVNCFEATKQSGGELSDQQIIRNDPKVKDAPTGLATRRNTIARIFAAQAECRALQECFSIKGNPTTEAKARQLHNQHCS